MPGYVLKQGAAILQMQGFVKGNNERTRMVRTA